MKTPEEALSQWMADEIKIGVETYSREELKKAHKHLKLYFGFGGLARKRISLEDVLHGVFLILKRNMTNENEKAAIQFALDCASPQILMMYEDVDELKKFLKVQIFAFLTKGITDEDKLHRYWSEVYISPQKKDRWEDEDERKRDPRFNLRLRKTWRR